MGEVEMGHTDCASNIGLPIIVIMSERFYAVTSSSSIVLVSSIANLISLTVLSPYFFW